jgi:hypothetical protein
MYRHTPRTEVSARKNMLPEPVGHAHASETAVANAKRVFPKADAPLHFFHVPHLPCFREVALGRPGLYLPARANR